MKFRSTTGEEIHIALTSGHTALVGVEPTELPANFHKEAIARGCLPEGVEPDAAPDTSGAFDRKKVIVDALNLMMDGDTEGDFKNDGKPNLTALNKRVGFQVERVEADAIWEEVSQAGK